VSGTVRRCQNINFNHFMRLQAQGTAFLANSETGMWEEGTLPNSETGIYPTVKRERKRSKPATESTVAQGRL